jgi:hypothetical protein
MKQQAQKSSLTVLQVIDLWKLNRALLASKMGMPKGTFNNKLSASHASTFSNEENIKLIGILREMAKDIDSVTDIDFNDALKALVK